MLPSVPQNVTVTRPLRGDLDKKAVEAVEKWRFDPAISRDFSHSAATPQWFVSGHSFSRATHALVVRGASSIEYVDTLQIGDWLEFRCFCETSCLSPSCFSANLNARNQRRTTLGMEGFGPCLPGQIRIAGRPRTAAKAGTLCAAPAQLKPCPDTRQYERERIRRPLSWDSV